MFKMMASFSLNTRTQPGTPLINDFVDHADDVMATRHLRHCEILQSKVSSQAVQYENIVVICSKNPTNATIHG